MNDVDIVPAVCGPVPSCATAHERREVASRYRLLDTELVAGAGMTGELWAPVAPTRRCLIRAIGVVTRPQPPENGTRRSLIRRSEPPGQRSRK